MAATIAATETQTEQCSKYCTAFRAFRPSGAAGAGDGELKRKLEVDESVRKPRFRDALAGMGLFQPYLCRGRLFPNGRGRGRAGGSHDFLIALMLGVFQKSKSGFQAVARPIEMFLSEQHSDSDVLASTNAPSKQPPSPQWECSSSPAGKSRPPASSPPRRRRRTGTARTSCGTASLRTPGWVYLTDKHLNAALEEQEPTPQFIDVVNRHKGGQNVNSPSNSSGHKRSIIPKPDGVEQHGRVEHNNVNPRKLLKKGNHDRHR
nr:hypothetical protein ACMD2_23578 [Ipomoea batatas]